MNGNILANNLRRLRQEKKYTQEQIAEKLGVSPQSVSRWECGNTLPDVLLLPEIARFYCVTVDDLFKESISAYKNYAQRLLSVYEASGKTEDFLRAEEEFEKLLENGDYTMDDLCACGIMYHYMFRDCKKKALQFFDRVIKEGKEKDPVTYYRTWQQKISLLAELGKSEKNIETQTKNLKKDFENPMQWVLLVEAYQHAGQKENAYECVLKSIKRFPNEATLYVYAGDLCKSLKKYEEAFEYWDKALELDKTFLDVKYSKGFCYEEMGEYEKAYEMWIEIVKDLDEKGFQYEKEFPLSLAKKCQEKMQKMDG